MRANFWRFWASTSVSSLGDGVRFTAVPLLAAAFTRDPLLLSLVSGAGTLSWLLFSVPFGAIADRYTRKQLILVSHLLRGFVTGALAAFVGLGFDSIGLLILANFVLGAFDVLAEVSAQAALPALVPKSELKRANTWLSTSSMLFDEFIGPLLGAGLFAAAAILPFIVDFASFAIAAALIFLVSGSLGERSRSASPPTTMRQEIREGAVWLRRSGIVFWNVLIATTLNIVRAATLAILVLYALDMLDIGQIGFAALNMSLALGAILGSAASGRIASLAGDRAVLLGIPPIIGVIYVLMGLIQNPFVVGGGLAVIGFTMMNWIIVSTSTRQQLTPNHMLGRVTSLARFVAWGALPLGAVSGGLVAQMVGVPQTFWIGGMFILVISILIIVFARHQYVPRRVDQKRPPDVVQPDSTVATND